MAIDPEIDQLKREIESLDAENRALRAADFRASKAEAMLAFEYDRIPAFLKRPRAIRAQRKVSTALLFVIPVMLVVIAVVGSFNAYHDHMRSVETQKSEAELSEAIERNVAKDLGH